MSVTLEIFLCKLYLHLFRIILFLPKLVRSFGVITRYHLGTAAFGGLILAVVQSIRAFILYLQMKFGQRQARSVMILSVTPHYHRLTVLY